MLSKIGLIAIISLLGIIGCNHRNQSQLSGGAPDKKVSPSKSTNLGFSDTGVGISINDQGDWVSVGTFGEVWKNGKKIAELGKLGHSESGVGVSINNQGDWD